MPRYSKGFKKILGRWDSIAINIGIVIGVGIFRVPAEVAAYLPSSCYILLAWAIGGLITLLGALCYAELAAAFPQTGGNYVYLRKSYGTWAGFLYGWTEFLVIRTGSIAAVAFVFAEYLSSLLSTEPFLIKPFAIGIIVILSVINIVGLRYGKGIQNVFTIAKITAIVGIILLGVVSGKGDIAHFRPLPVSPDRGLFPLFGLALIPILWTYGGWHENTFVAGETKNAERIIPSALIIATLIITGLYLAINALYIYMIVPREMADLRLIASSVLQILCGLRGSKIVEALIVVSSIGAINAMIITGSRITYAMAKDNALFRILGEVHPAYGTPLWAIILNAAWATVLVIFGTFNMLLFFTGIVVWLVFAFAAAGLFVLRHKYPALKRPYKIWGYPVVPAIFVIICVALSINTLLFYPRQSMIGLCLTLTGVPIFILSRKRKVLLKRR